MPHIEHVTIDDNTYYVVCPTYKILEDDDTIILWSSNGPDLFRSIWITWNIISLEEKKRLVQ